jgi:hypothetical protein
LLNYFEIHSNYITESGYSKSSINFTECTNDYLSDEILNFQGIKLCPKIDFSIPINSFKKFEWKFDIRECLDEARGCKKNPELYKSLRKGDKIFSFLILTDFEENMLNFTQPYEYDFKFLPTEVNQDLDIQLKGSEIKTQSLFGFYETESRLKFSKDSKKETIFPQQIFSYTMTFNSKDTTFYQRIYKTFTGAFSNAYSLFKFYSWLFSIILNIHYSYSVNNVIINTNFDYRNSMNNSDEFKMPRKLFNTSINSDLNQKEFPKERKNGGAKQHCSTLSLIYKKVSSCRFFFCNKKNSTKKFYDSSTGLIKIHLSIEKLFFYLIEFAWVKNNSIHNLGLNNLRADRMVLYLTTNQGNKDELIDILLNNDNEIKNGEISNPLLNSRHLK